MPKIIYTDSNRFYVYAFLRKDNTPYYIGKGQGNRAWSKRQFRPVDDSRIVILKERLTETEAFDLETELIEFYGRKDNETGILRNLTDGGEGTSGYINSEKTKANMSAAKSGVNNPMFGKKPHNFGKKASEETIANMSAALSGVNNPMFGKKPHNFGKKASEETIAKRSGENHYNFGKKRSPEIIAKISKSNTGKKHSPESRAKMRESWILRKISNTMTEIENISVDV